MNKNILLFTAIFAIIYIFINEKINLQTNEQSTTFIDENTEVISNINDAILPLTQDAGQEYIDKIYFVGDSTTYHFFKAGINRTHILVPDSLTLKLSSDINNITVGYEGLTISKAIKNAKCEIVIITIGVNGADGFTKTKYKTYYYKLIEDIQKESPNTKIILQSVFPVTKLYSDKNIGITNSGIDKLNEWAKEIAFENGLKYLDTQSILKDGNGAQFEYYNEQDGIHMNTKAYQAIIEYIRTHAID